MGRVLSNLPFGSQQFESQMPHFEEAVAAALPMQALFAGYDKYPPSFQAVMPFLVASLVYHQRHIALHYHGHPVCSSPLFTTRKNLLKELEPKLLGGNSARSILPLTGRSYLGATFAKVVNIEQMVSEIRDVICHAPSDLVLPSPRERPLLAPPLAPGREEMRADCDRLKLLISRMESFFPAPSAKTKVWPVGYVPASFRVPQGVTVHECFRHWVSGWRFFEGKKLPARDDGTSQATAFSKCASVMTAMLGKAPEQGLLEQDPEYWFKFLWQRLCTTFGWSIDEVWSVSTCYDKILNQKDKRALACHATATPTLAEAAAAAAVTATVAMRSANVLMQEAARAPAPAPVSIASPAPNLTSIALPVTGFHTATAATAASTAVAVALPVHSGEVECVRCCFCGAYLSVDVGASHDRKRNCHTNMLQHMRQKHIDDDVWQQFQTKMGSHWDPKDALKLWVMLAPKVPCSKSQPAGHFNYKPAFIPQVDTNFGTSDGGYRGGLFRGVPHGVGVRVAERTFFMGTFQANVEVLGVHFDEDTNTLYGGTMLDGRRHAGGKVYHPTTKNVSALL